MAKAAVYRRFIKACLLSAGLALLQPVWAENPWAGPRADVDVGREQPSERNTWAAPDAGDGTELDSYQFPPLDENSYLGLPLGSNPMTAAPVAPAAPAIPAAPSTDYRQYFGTPGTYPGYQSPYGYGSRGYGYRYPSYGYRGRSAPWGGGGWGNDWWDGGPFGGWSPFSGSSWFW